MKFRRSTRRKCQGVFGFASAKWIDFTAYWPKLPQFIKRMTRDEEYIKTPASAVDQFNTEL